MFMFHHFLIAERRPSADALREAQLWMLDPHRKLPATAPAELRVFIGQPDIDAVYAWGAFTHQGRSISS
jgi:CHAT domain-containing protein